MAGTGASTDGGRHSQRGGAEGTLSHGQECGHVGWPEAS